MQIVRLALDAMATRFEIVLQGQNPVALRAAGEEAFEEIERLESQLSLYRPESDIARVNARAALAPVRVSPLVFSLLKRANEMTAATDGAFDVTIAPLVRCWGFMGGTGHPPDPGELAYARDKIGMQHVILDEEHLTVQFDRDGMMIDLGAIGKGLAVDRAAEFLRESGMTSVLLHGGTSTVCAIGKPMDADCWKIAIDLPEEATGRPEPLAEDLLSTVSLFDETLSVSAVWGRCFNAEGKRFGHVIDPRAGEPVSKAVMSALVLPSGTETDALSTALLVLGPEGLETVGRFRPNAKALVVTPRGNGFDVARRGL